MTILILSALATASILTAIEGLIVSVGKWRGLVAIICGISFPFILGIRDYTLIVYALASTFVGLTASLAVEQAFTGVSVRQMRGLPKRVDRL